jgi:RNA polymerase sigma-70 factor (ECF subfamily)
MTETIADPTDDDAIDAALVARWREGDDRAATELVRRHAPALARFAASLGERDEVEELVQDTFVRAFQALERLSGRRARCARGSSPSSGG